MKKRRILLLAILGLIVVGFIGYAALGGFRKPRVKLGESPGYVILGKRYKGKADNKQLKETYRQTHTDYKDKIIDGPFAVIHLSEPDKNNEDIDAIFGVIVMDSSSSLPKGYKFYTWKPIPIAQASITSHYSVAPSPETINQSMKLLAEKSGYDLAKTSLERYYSNDSLIVEVPLVKK